MMKPCVNCGQLLEERSRCTDCRSSERKHQAGYQPSKSSRQRGYDSRWDSLSSRARRIQPWCTDCGATEDLTADHSLEAWNRYYAGLPIRLRDIDVVCRVCNIDRGTPGGMRSSRHAGTRAGQAGSATETGSQL